MHRMNGLFGWIVLLAGLLLAAPASAHGGNHIAGSAAAAPATADAGVVLVVGDSLEIRTAGHYGAAPLRGIPSCPDSDNGCCASHCCTAAGLNFGPGDAEPGYQPPHVVALNDRQPSDAALTTLFRPPCR
jgi:hypothetical protein